MKQRCCLFQGDWPVVLPQSSASAGLIDGQLALSHDQVQAPTAPAFKLLPYELGLESKRRADGQEGKKISPVVAEKPFFGLTRRLALERPNRRLELLLKTKKSVFEHGVQ